MVKIEGDTYRRRMKGMGKEAKENMILRKDKGKESRVEGWMKRSKENMKKIRMSEGMEKTREEGGGAKRK